MKEPAWIKGRVPRGYWQDLQHRLQYMKWLGRQLGYRTIEDWYRIKYKHFRKNNGYVMLNTYFSGSPSQAVMETFPEYDWKPWLFIQVPNGYWDNAHNRQEYMEWLGNKLNITTPVDWYNVTKKVFEKNNVKSFLNYYAGSPTAAIIDYIPDFEFHEWFFTSVHREFWADRENRRRYMEWLGQKLNFDNLDDWYKITKTHFKNNYGGTLLNCYDGSSTLAVMDIFPEHNWKPWLFHQVPARFWEDPKNIKQCMEWLGNQLGLKQTTDWYQVTRNDFIRHKCGGILNVFDNSPIRAIKYYIPTYNWQEWLFTNVTMNFWDEEANAERYIHWLGEKLGFKDEEDWYKVTNNDFKTHRGRSLLAKFNDSASMAVIKHFPDYNWEHDKFSEGMKKQKRLYKLIRKLFPDRNIEWNYRHKKLRFTLSERPMELDVYIPSLEVAFEYQGEQHYFPVECWGGAPAFNDLIRRDEEKRMKCSELGITLIEIQYTWDGSEKGLKDAIGVISSSSASGSP